MLSSQAVITCDNSEYVRSGDDTDRVGVILSVPFYNLNGELAGTISAIVRTDVLAAYLPNDGYVLLNASQALELGTLQGSALSTSHQWIASGSPDPDLFYSEVRDVRSRDPQGGWRLWVGKPNEDFWSSGAARAVRTFELWAYVVLALLGLSTIAVFALFIAQTRNRLHRSRQQLLENHAAAMGDMAEQQTLLKARAEEANLAKSQFLANMSHELRTPLNAIIGYGEIVQEEATDIDRQDMVSDLDRIIGAGKHLLSLINSILDLSKVEAGRVEVEPEEFNADELVAMAVEFGRPMAHKKGLRLAVEQSAPLGRMHTDPLKVRQCLLNLLSNAIKFTDNGSVTLRVARRDSPQGELLICDVIDTGSGLSAEQLSRLFKPFTQADASVARTHGGTGLGLVITRDICRLLGGDVTVSSVVDAGSTFTMSVLATYQARTEVAEELPAVETRHGQPMVLVIDDEPDARDLMQRALERLGFAVCAANTAEQGLKLAASRAPVLICLDLNLPDQSGWTVLEALTKRSEAPPVIVVSIEDCRAKSMKSGACEHLTKPLDREAFSAAALRFAQADTDSDRAEAWNTDRATRVA
ncbi:MAG: ATP-binding protein [Terricaulis sp.]